VEQQIRHQVLLPKDNLVLGPAEYFPKPVERNISTPSLGRYRTPADHFRPFKSTSSVKSSSRSPSPGRRGEGSQISSIDDERSDFMTIFHHHDERVPYDPKTQFSKTPGPYLGQDTPFESIKCDGKAKVRNVLPFGPDDVPFGERNFTKPALPSYDIKYDSNQIRPTTRLGTFPISKRIYVPTKEDMKRSLKRAEEEHNTIDNERHFHPRPSTTDIAVKTGLSVFEIRCNLVPLPKLKTRAPPKLIFDDSSYRKKTMAKPMMLTRKQLDQQANVEVFSKLATIPRQHKSVEFSNFQHLPTDGTPNK
jgi:hypothetical protein